MKNPYIKPTVNVLIIQTAQMIAVSGPNVSTTSFNPNEENEFIGAKGFDFFEEEETPNKNKLNQEEEWNEFEEEE